MSNRRLLLGDTVKEGYKLADSIKFDRGTGLTTVNTQEMAKYGGQNSTGYLGLMNYWKIHLYDYFCGEAVSVIKFDGDIKYTNSHQNTAPNLECSMALPSSGPSCNYSIMKNGDGFYVSRLPEKTYLQNNSTWIPVIRDFTVNCLDGKITYKTNVGDGITSESQFREVSIQGTAGVPQKRLELEMPATGSTKRTYYAITIPAIIVNEHIVIKPVYKLITHAPAISGTNLHFQSGYYDLYNCNTERFLNSRFTNQLGDNDMFNNQNWEHVPFATIYIETKADDIYTPITDPLTVKPN